MKIKLKKVRWKNFLSYGINFTEINLEKYNTNLICGDNGTGKTVLLDAICFGLFGKPFRKANKPTLVNSINNKDLIVEIEFDIANKDYTIRRGIKPAIFELYSNGVLVNQTASSKDYQSYLENNILKLNFRSFTQIVVLGSTNFVPFMELPAAHRREVIEDLLDIKVFSNMNILLKDKILSNKNKLFEVDKDISVVREKIKLLNNFISRMEEDKSNRLQEYNNSLKEIEDNLTKFSARLQELDTQKNKLEEGLLPSTKYTSKINSINSYLSKLEVKKSDLDRDLQFFNNSVSCPTCMQHIDDNVKSNNVSKIETSLSILEKSRNKLLKLHAEVQAALNEVNKKHSDVAKIVGDMGLVNYEIQHNKTLKRSILAKIEKEKSKPTEVDQNTSIEEFTEMETQLTATRDKLILEKEVMNVAAFLLKDGGIKAKIITQYVPIINENINKYLKHMDFEINFQLNESFEEVIKSRHRDVFSYHNFSEGEKQRINLALIFAWRNIAKIKSSIDINLLVMDEVFDSSLDEDGIECLQNILNLSDIRSNSNIFVITHRSGMEDKFDNIIKVKKVNNFSYIE